MKNKLFKIGAVLALALVFGCGAAYAADETNVTIPSGERIPTDLIRAGQTVDVGGDVAGDAILAGETVSFSGDATGDILIAGGNVRVKGDSEGDVRAIGATVILDGVVKKNVTVLGGSVIIEEGSMIEGNLYVAGGSVELRGKVGGNAIVYGSQMIFTGQVSGNGDFKTTGGVVIRDDASIGGDLSYTGNTDLLIGPDVVKGATTRIPIEEYTKQYDRGDGDFSLGMAIWQLLSLLLVGFVLFKLFGKQVRELTGPIRSEEIWNRIATGIVSLVLNVAGVFLIFLSLIGAPLALILLFFFIILVIIALTILPMLIGRLFNGRFKLYAAEDRYLMVDFVLGYVLMQVIGLIPFAGPFVLLFLFLFSYGRVTQYVMAAIKANR